VADAQGRLNGLLLAGDLEPTRPTPLRGWTVGHVLTHLARNADSHVRRASAAGEGRVVEQYTGGLDGREDEIQAGATRPARDLIEDVVSSADRLDTTWLELPPEAWDAPTRDVRGVERPLYLLVGRRWQELEVHAVDLDIGVTYRDWSDDFVTVWLPRLRARHGDRPRPPRVDERDELAWLYGRLRIAGVPPPEPWG
jgi:maleylpyruvate isomerase